MSYLIDAAGENLTGTFDSTQNGQPCTLACWVNRPDWDSSPAGIMSLSESPTIHDNNQQIQSNGAIDRITASSRTADNANAEYDFGSPDLYNGVWVPCVAVFTSSTLRDIYINSISETASDTLTRNLSNVLDTIYIGNRIENQDGPLNGTIAHPAIWVNTALSTAEITAYLNSASQADIEAIDSSNLSGYWPLTTENATQTNLGVLAGGDLTVTNATFSNDEPFGPVITVVDGDNAWNDGDTGLVISGTGFV